MRRQQAREALLDTLADRAFGAAYRVRRCLVGEVERDAVLADDSRELGRIPVGSVRAPSVPRLVGAVLHESVRTCEFEAPEVRSRIEPGVCTVISARRIVLSQGN